MPRFLSSMLFTALLSAHSASANWVSVAKQSSSTSDYFGNAVAMSSKILAIGAPYGKGDSKNLNAGNVHIYERDGLKLSLVDEIDGQAFNQLGSALDVSQGTDRGGDNDEMVIIGSPRYSSSTKTNAGMAQVFYHNSRKNKWMQLGQDIVGKWNDEFLGETVAISDDGEVIAVGTPIGDELRRGRVQMYKLDTVNDEWVDIGFPIVGHAEGEKSGTAISIVQTSTDDNDIHHYCVAIGSSNGLNSIGVVKVYHYDDDVGDWDQIGEDMEGDVKMDHFGQSLSMAYNADSNKLLLAVGIASAPGYGGDPSYPESSTDGRVQVYFYNFDFDGETAWMQHGDEIEQLEDNDGTGKVVELSRDGAVLAIGSPDHNDGNGCVRVFKWNEGYHDYLEMGAHIMGEKEEGLGSALSIFENELAIGSPYKNQVQIYKYHESHHGKSGFKKFISTVFILGAVSFVVMMGYRKLKSRGFKWSSFAAGIPGASAIRHRGRSAVETEENDEWPFGFFSAADRDRINEARRAEEGKVNVDRVVLHGMPRPASQSEDSDSASEDGSYKSKNDSVHEMRQLS